MRGTGPRSLSILALYVGAQLWSGARLRACVCCPYLPAHSFPIFCTGPAAVMETFFSLFEKSTSQTLCTHRKLKEKAELYGCSAGSRRKQAWQLKKSTLFRAEHLELPFFALGRKLPNNGASEKQSPFPRFYGIFGGEENLRKPPLLPPSPFLSSSSGLPPSSQREIFPS